MTLDPDTWRDAGMRAAAPGAAWLRIPPRLMAAFAIAAAALGFLLNGYQYGLVDHVDHLPLVERAMDPDYLTRDPYLNGQGDLNVRFVFTWMMAGLARFASLPAAFFAVHLFCAIAVALVTAFAARDLSGGSALAGMLAAAAAVVVQCFHLGNTAAVFSNQLLPESPALPLALAGLWLGIQGKPLRAVGLCGLGSLFHPLIGLECGALAMLAACVQYKSNVQLKSSKRRWIGFLAGLVILAAFAGFWAVAPMLGGESGRIPDPEFIGTLAWLRHPHHYIPSSWPISNFIRTGLFLIAVALAWNRLRADKTPARHSAWPVAAVLAATLLLWFGGYFFVEVRPSRLWAVAQVFRLGFVIGWLGLILIAGGAARHLERGEGQKGLLAALGLAGAPAAFVSQMSLAAVESRIWRNKSESWRRFALWIASAATILAIAAYPGRIWGLASLAVCGAGLALGGRMRHPAACLTPPVAAAAIIAALFAVNRHFSPPWLVAALADIQPVVSLEDIHEDSRALADYARERTPADSLFLTPPEWGSFRLHARRAIVVDWKCIPYQDFRMREWRWRLEDCYGPLEDQPDMNNTRQRMAEHYRNIDDRQLRLLRERYAIDFAILFEETTTDFQILATAAGYKLAELK